MTEAELKKIEAQWKSDMDRKVDRLCRFADAYEDYLRLCLRRETERDKLRTAVIEKTLGAAIWACLVFLGLAVWQYVKEHVKL